MTAKIIYLNGWPTNVTTLLKSFSPYGRFTKSLLAGNSAIGPSFCTFPSLCISIHLHPSPSTAFPPRKMPFPPCPFCWLHPPPAINLPCSLAALPGALSHRGSAPPFFKPPLILPSPQKPIHIQLQWMEIGGRLPLKPKPCQLPSNSESPTADKNNPLKNRMNRINPVSPHCTRRSSVSKPCTETVCARQGRSVWVTVHETKLLGRGLGPSPSLPCTSVY